MRKKVTRIRSLLLTGCLASWGCTSFVAWASAWPTAAPPALPSPPVETVAQNRTTPPVPPLPEPLPTPRSPATAGIVGLMPTPEDDLGVGHLRPRDLAFLDATDDANAQSLQGAGWLRAAAIPIYIEPNGAHWGWIINGWLVPNGQPPIALGQDASFSMLQTYSELSSFPVTEIREDGWFQFQYTPAGRAWAHVDHLNLGSVDLAVETWANRFVESDRVEFRQHGLSQSLYNTPEETQASILGLVGANSVIQPLAFEGNWMRVQVTQPAEGCASLPGAVTQEGWMRWRSEEQQPLVWLSAQDCE